MFTCVNDSCPFLGHRDHKAAQTLAVKELKPNALFALPQNWPDFDIRWNGEHKATVQTRIGVLDDLATVLTDSEEEEEEEGGGGGGGGGGGDVGGGGRGRGRGGRGDGVGAAGGGNRNSSSLSPTHGSPELSPVSKRQRRRQDESDQHARDTWFSMPHGVGGGAAGGGNRNPYMPGSIAPGFSWNLETDTSAHASVASSRWSDLQSPGGQGVGGGEAGGGGGDTQDSDASSNSSDL